MLFFLASHAASFSGHQKDDGNFSLIWHSSLPCSFPFSSKVFLFRIILCVLFCALFCVLFYVIFCVLFCVLLAPEFLLYSSLPLKPVMDRHLKKPLLVFLPDNHSRLLLQSLPHCPCIAQGLGSKNLNHGPSPSPPSSF